MHKMIYICDRCGMQSDMELRSLPHFNSTERTVDLCADCASRFENMFRVFMKNETFEERNRREAIKQKEVITTKGSDTDFPKYYTLNDISDFGKRLQIYMRTHNLTNNQIAELIGVNPCVVSRWINHGLERTNIRTETKINHFLNTYLMSDSVLKKEA